MSLDLFLKFNNCPHCDRADYTENLNITYNLASMWYEIFPKDKQMIDIDGALGEVAEIDLTIALDELKENPEKFIKLNPTNGWGCYEDFVKYIEKLIELCKEHPNGIWESHR